MILRRLVITFYITSVAYGMYLSYLLSTSEFKVGMSSRVVKNVSHTEQNLFHTVQNVSIEKNILFEASFKFPSVEQRVNYYMGDWANKTFDNKNICNRINQSFHDILLTVNFTNSKLRGSVDFSNPYIVDAYFVILQTELKLAESSEASVIIHYGDNAPRNRDNLPTVGKFRKGNDKSVIIWPLTIKRHYNPLIALSSVKDPLWSEKKPVAVWRGGSTGKRGDLVKQMLKKTTTSDIDIGFSHIHEHKTDLKKFVKGEMSMEEQLKYKYIISFEGNDIASGLKWQLASNSVVFMRKPRIFSYTMEDLLVPFVHYIPLNSNYSNLDEMLSWAKKHDSKCQNIANQSKEFMRNVWNSRKAAKDNLNILKQLATKYHSLFNNALESCVHDVPNDVPPEKLELWFDMLYLK